MALLYSCVSHGTKVLADHADVAGNFEVVTQQILDKTENEMKLKHTYTTDQSVLFLIYYCFSTRLQNDSPLLSYSVVWTSVAVSFSIVPADIGNEF